MHLLEFEWAWCTFPHFFVRTLNEHAVHRMRVPSLVALFNRLACQYLSSVFHFTGSITFRWVLLSFLSASKPATHIVHVFRNIKRESSIRIVSLQFGRRKKREYSYTFMLFYFLNSLLRVCSLASKFQCNTNLNRIIKIKNRLNKCSLISSSKSVDLCPVQNTNRIRIQ